jgi:hypothetical protein
VAAAELVADEFVRQNFGSPNERATTLVYDCVITMADTGKPQTLRFMRKSPDKIRIHFLADDLVTLAMASGGSITWLQKPARPAERLSGEQAATLVETAPFDHPLVGYRDRAAQLTLRGGGVEPFELTVRERDGRAVVSTIDPVTYQETRQLVQTAAGRESELRLRDYRRIGPMNVPCTQELWRGGALVVTTRLERLSTEVTLLDQLFDLPTSEMITYMDYMSGLALLRKQADVAATAPTGGTPSPSTP